MCVVSEKYAAFQLYLDDRGVMFVWDTDSQLTDYTTLMGGPPSSLSRREGQKFLSLPEMNPCCPVTAPSHPISTCDNRSANCKSQPFVCLKACFISSTFQLVLTKQLMPQLPCQIGDTDGKQFAPVVIQLLFSLQIVFNPFHITFPIKYIIPTHRMLSAH